MAEKKPTIVIKKITINGGGAHGGAWKVAFADFMTALMAFFLVMWLLSTQSEQSKKAISDYFSSPSVIEYQFNNYGVELTLEKLFLDLINEPLKVFQSFVTPVDRTPNIMAMGMKKVVMAHMAEQLGGHASSVNVTADSVVFEIPDNQLFHAGTANPNGMFINVMERVKGVTTGLEDSDVIVTSVVFDQSVPGQNHIVAKNVAESRLDLVQAKIQNSLENPSVDVTGKSAARFDDRSAGDRKGQGGGYIRLEIRQKKQLSDGKKPRPLANGALSGGVSGGSSGEATQASTSSSSRYDDVVNQIAKEKTSRRREKRERKAE